MRDNKPHGGVRAGAGRPKKSGRYGEPTSAVRVPVSALPVVRLVLAQCRQQNLRLGGAESDSEPSFDAVYFPAAQLSEQSVPIYATRVPAGKPAPADDYTDEIIDFNQLLIKRPESTYSVRVSGESMIDAGIMSGDVLIIEQASEARHGQIVIAAIDGEPTVKRYYARAGNVRLVAENPAYPAIDINPEMAFEVWGVVTGLVRQLK